MTMGNASAFRLVWWFGSSLHLAASPSRELPNQNHTRIIGFLVSFRIRSSQKSQPQNAANSGFGTLANWLSLAAAPTFAIMALLTGVAGNQANMLCAAGQAMSPLNGMAAMYALMSAFHLAPWLKLVAARAGGHLQADATSQTPGDAVARPQRPGAK